VKEPSEISLSVISSSQLDQLLDAIDIFFPNGDESGVLAFRKKVSKDLTFLADAVLHLNDNLSPLRSVLRIVRKRYNCFAIVEHPYFDLDVWAGYSLVYSASFKRFKRTCHRIHFFENSTGTNPDEKAESVIKMLRYGKTLEQIERTGVSYKGFTTIRPIGSFGLGRTAIKFDKRKPSQIDGINNHQLELTGTPYCNSEFLQEANVCSTKFDIKAIPFIQQDPVIGVCAAASLWTVSQVLANRFGLHKFQYDAITQQAFYSRMSPSFPSRKDTVFGPGLSVDNISDALSHTGATPMKVYARESQSIGASTQARFRLMTYTFIESNIPAILCFLGPSGGHAVALLGHLLPGLPDGSDLAETFAEKTYGDKIKHRERHHLIGQGVQLYYAHNDAYGPFDRIHIFSDKIAEQIRQTLRPDDFRKNSACLIQRGRGSPNPDEVKDAKALVIGLPRYVQNSPEGAILHAINEFDKILPNLQSQFKVLWRCLLVETSKFKRSLFTSDRRFPVSIRRQYASLHLPRYTWLVEFTVFEENNYSVFGVRREIDGEFLYDPTTPWKPECVTMRVLNLFRDFRGEDTSLKTIGRDLNSKPCFVHIE
jgi:hypothetical protein